jgi:hypothetical protein
MMTKGKIYRCVAKLGIPKPQAKKDPALGWIDYKKVGF